MQQQPLPEKRLFDYLYPSGPLGAIKELHADDYFRLPATGIPEIDQLRDQWYRCKYIGAHHACILLTDHILERFLKLMLIGKNTENFNFSDFATINTRFESAVQKYLTYKFDLTTSVALGLGILKQYEYEKLSSFFYFFSEGLDRPKLKRRTREMVSGKLYLVNTNEGVSFASVPYLQVNVPFEHGQMLDGLADFAFEQYFILVDTIMPRVIKRCFPDGVLWVDPTKEPWEEKY
jgi:hypothetical protein